MDLGSITAAFTSLKVAGEIAKGLIDLKTTTEVQAKAFELGRMILDAQGDLLAANAAQAALIGEVSDLKGQIARMKNWETEKQRYKLIAPFPGCMVYALKKSMSGGDTPHYLCTTCYQKGQPTILQCRENPPPKGGGMGHSSYNCPECKTEARTGWVNVPAPKYFEDIAPET